MSNLIQQRLAAAPVVPLIQAEDPEVAVQIANALAAGGLTVVEVVFRTAEALQCLAAVAGHCKDVIVGAGTVLNVAQAEAAIESGARFLVSPGLDVAVVKLAMARNIEVFPGVSTATETMQAWNLDLRTVKFFPAGLLGGPAMLKALGSVFGEMRFMPTGGISAANLADYLALPSVIACGGSWLTPKESVAAGDYDVITGLAREAVEIASRMQGTD
jgi:2-dehydro-3-deoxyphosphogluconate aldolase/(4S)-4-hydroxy-2-oxoglutarate aldolase